MATTFTPGSLEAFRACQVEHRFERKTVLATPAAGGEGAPAPLGRRTLSHQVEAQKHAEAEAAAAAAAVKHASSSQRCAAALAWLQRREEERQAVKQGKLKHQLPEWQTSDDNPLNFRADADAAGAAPLSIKAAARAALAGDADKAAARQERVSRRRALRIEDNLQLGSLSLKDGGEAPQDLHFAASREAVLKKQEHDEIVAALLLDYPHGIPKRMLLDLRELGITNAPGLGWGLPGSSPRHDTCLLRPM